MSLLKSVSGMFRSRAARRGISRSPSRPNRWKQVLRVEALEELCLLDGSWATLAPMPTPRSGAAVAALNDQLYVATGATTGGTPATAVEAYDPTTNSWARKASIPTARPYGGAAAIGGILYVVGGCEANDCRIGTTRRLEAYDPTTDTWTRKADLPTARSAMAVGAIDGKLYVAGGVGPCPPCPVYDKLEVYDPAMDTWTTKQPMPTARRQVGGTVINGQFYVVGGLDSAGTIVATLEAYDPTTNAWATKAPIPAPRDAPGAGSVNGILYAVSGQSSDHTPVNTVYGYNPGTDRWTTDAPIPMARYLAQPASINGVLYVAGNGPSNTPTSTLEAFTPTTLTATGTTLSAKMGHRFAAVVASFTDHSPNPGVATDYSAVVDWGDGSSLSTGGITDNGGGNYDVAASHTYFAAGEYQATITITDNRDPSRTATACTTIDVFNHRRGRPRTAHNPTVTAFPVDALDLGLSRSEKSPQPDGELAALATLLRAEPNFWLDIPLSNTSGAAETMPIGERTTTHLPPPNSTLEAWWMQGTHLLAQHLAWAAVAVGHAAAPDPLALESLDELGMGLVL